MLNRISVYIHNRERIVSASHTIGCGFATRSGHTKDHDKMVQTALHVIIRVEV